MSWVRLDDRFHSDPKVVQAGNAAAGVFARALSYCADHLTDGFVPLEWVKTISKPAERRALIEAELWVEAAAGQDFIAATKEEAVRVKAPTKGYFIPKYLRFNPSAEKVRDQQAKTGARVRALRERRAA